MRRTQNAFQTVKTEGAILPVDLLRRVLDGDRDVPGLRPEDDYHLAKSERLNEAATCAWNRLQGAWEGFKGSMETLQEVDTGTSLTRERWLLIIFRELGYGRLTTRKAYDIEGKTYPISHEWQNAPIHLVSFRQDLDKRTPGRAGAARVSPHSLVQEFLNRSDDHLWGFVSNGLNLRLLRDNVSLTRQAFVEFDLQAMMDSEAYSDFFLLFLLCHQSRVEVPEGKTPEHCWLEKWYNTAAQQGVRALDQLREGVQKAIEALGGGFLVYPSNAELREQLRSGSLSTQDYYRQILRQVYRFLFLFVAEDRELLSDPNAPIEARKLYFDYYSTQHLRSLAGKTRGTRHPDLWRALRLVLDKLHGGCPQLALPALGSYLFSTEATSDLNDQDIANSDLLKAFRALTFTVDRQVRRTINYRNLGSEELGSVYESLLEMHPTIHMEASSPDDRFKLAVAAGSERKTTGSYYTPSSLVNCLLDSALDPVLNEVCKKPDPEKSLLELKVCDPACGSGHFLISAAHRIAKRLAAIRAGEDEPAPEHYQHALRDVIGLCIYGVDINPMAVELCKVNLWMESLEPGKPFSFLDHKIRCGNSLLGVTPALLEKGVPDEAFKPITGDDKKFCQVYKKLNGKEHGGQMSIGEIMPWNRLGNLTAAMVNLDHISDNTIEGVRQKQKRYEELTHSTGYLHGHFLADAWCAAFVWKKIKTEELPYPITEDIFRKIEKNPRDVQEWMRDEIIRLAKEYQFFHWHLEFPDVFLVPSKEEQPDNEQNGWSGGFDVLLGNPPWERVQFEERAFFADKKPDIYAERSQSKRRKMIAKLQNTDLALFHIWQNLSRHIEGEAHLLRSSKRFPLSTVDKFNLYAVFLELNTQIYNKIGHIGLIVKAGYISDSLCAKLFSSTMESKQLVSIAEFENKRKIFPAVHPQERFALVTIAHEVQCADFIFDIHSIEELSDKLHHIQMSFDDILNLSPNTKNCPKFSDSTHYRITKWCYEKFPLLHIKEPDKNPWGISIDRYINVSDFSSSIILASEFDNGSPVEFDIDQSFSPLYEGKLFHQFDHCFASYEDTRDATTSELSYNTPNRHVSFYRFIPTEIATRRNSRLGKSPGILAVRDITNRTNERGVIAAIIPDNITDYTVRVIQLKETTGDHQLILLSILNSFVFDYLARQRIGGVHLSNYILEQLPAPAPNEISSSKWEFIVMRSLELTYTAWNLQIFAKNCGYDGPPFYWNDKRRFLIRCELHATFFHMYDIERDDVGYIMETFPIVKRKDEKQYGEYRTKRVILEIYDAMAQVMEENTAAVDAGRQPTAQYQTRLNPSPGPPTDAEGNFIPMAQWDHRPVHIHPSKEKVEKTPEELSLEEFVAMTYPATGTDNVICAAALTIIEQSDRLSSMDHLDTLLLATHPEWCKAFLAHNEHQAFGAIIQSVPNTLFVGDNQSIRWKECRDYLEQQRLAISVNHGSMEQTITLGSEWLSVKASLPSGADDIVKYAIEAMKRITDLRKDLSSVQQDQLRIIQAFEEQHRIYQLAA